MECNVQEFISFLSEFEYNSKDKITKSKKRFENKKLLRFYFRSER